MQELSKVDVVGVGLNATDTVIHIAEFPSRGSKVEYERELLMPGGQVASAMVACQAWGMTTRYVGKLGDDDAAALHVREFERFGVETQLVHVEGVASAKSLILVDDFGERTVLCRRDDRLMLHPEELNRAWIANARALLVDGHDTAAATAAARWARECGVPVIADLDDTYAGVEELVESIDYLIVSRDFPERLTGEPDLKTALRKAHERYGCTLTAATLGPDGALAWDGERFHQTPAYKVPVVDTTGAGDIFHAGFIYALLQGWELDRQLDFACAAAAINCREQGARGGICDVAAIEALMAEGARYEPMIRIFPKELFV
jgi:sulfofructose kinase